MDVDGSYLYRKYRSLVESGETVALPSCPSPPITGWKSVTEDSYRSIAPSVPHVTAGIYARFQFLLTALY